MSYKIYVDYQGNFEQVEQSKKRSWSREIGSPEYEIFYQRDIKDSDFSEIVQCLQYEHMEKGKDVFEYNSMGDKFYIILKGTVSVMIPNPDHKDFKRKFEEFQKHR